MINELFAFLSVILQKENIKFIYDEKESPVFSIILSPPSKICMIDLIPDKDKVLQVRYVYPFDKKYYIYAGIILENFTIAVTQLFSILFVDLKILSQNIPGIRYLVDSEEIALIPDPQNYKYSYHGSLKIKRKQH